MEVVFLMVWYAVYPDSFFFSVLFTCGTCGVGSDGGLLL